MTEPKDVPACPSTSEFTSGLGNWYLRLKAYRRRSGHHQVVAPREQLTQQVPTHQGVPGPWNSLSSAMLTATSRLPWRIQSRRRLPRDHKTNSIPDIACKQLMHNPVAERHTENPRDSLSLSSALPSSSSFLGVGSPTHVRTAIEGVAGGNRHSSSSGKTVHGLRMSCGGDVEENLKDCKCSESDNVRTSLFTSQLVGGLASPPERVSNRAGPVTSDETLHPTLDSRSVSEAHHSSSGTCSVSDKRTGNSIQGTAVCGKNHSASAESAAELRSLKSSRRTRSRPHVRPKFRAAHTTVTGCSCANYNSGIPSFVTLKKHSYSDRRSSSTATVSDGEKEHSSRFKKHERSMLCSQPVHPCDQSESTALKDEGQIRVKQEGRNLSCDGNENNAATGALGKLRRDSAVVALTGGNPHLNHSVRSFSTPAASPNLRPLAEGKTSWWTGLSSFTERLRGSGKGKERNTQSVQLVNEMTGIPQCDVNALPQLCRAHIHVAEFMNDELRGALAHHPMQDEALHLRWRSEATRPLLVHASLDVTCDDISGSVAGCGSSVKVYDIALSVTETFAALRLKCPEGWITAECVDASAWNRCCVCRSRNFCRLWTRDVVRDVDAQESQNIWTSSVTGGCSGTDHQRHYGLLQSCSCLAPLSIEDPSARSLSVSAPNEHECVCMGGDVYLDKERSPSSALVSGGSDHRSSMDMNLKHGPGTSCGMQLSETPMIPRGSSTGCGDGVFGSILGRMKSQSTNSKDVSVTRLRPVSRTTGKRGVTRLKSYLGINSAGTTCRKRDRKDVEDRERNGASWKRESCLLRCASNATSTQGTYSREPTQRWYFRVCRRRCQPALLCMDKSSREQTSGADRSNISQFATWGAACCAQDSELQGTGKRRLYRHNERRHMCTTGDRVCSEREACTGRGQDACLHGACRLVSEDVVQIWARTEEGWNRTDDEAYPASKGQVALWRNDGDAYGCETRGHSASLVTPGALSLYAVRSLLRAGSGRHRTQCSNDRLNDMQNANAIQERKLEISCRVHEASRRSSKFDALGRNSKKSHVEERHKHPVFGRRAPRGHCSESSVMRGPRMTETSPSRRTDKGTDSYYQVHPSEDVDSSSGGQEERLREQRTSETGFDTDDRAADRPSCLAAVDMLSQDSRTDTRLSPRFEISNRAEVPRLLRQRWLLYRVCGRSVVAVGSSISPFSPTVGVLYPGQVIPVFDAALAARFCFRDTFQHPQNGQRERCCGCCRFRKQPGADDTDQRNKQSYQKIKHCQSRHRLLGHIDHRGSSRIVMRQTSDSSTDTVLTDRSDVQSRDTHTRVTPQEASRFCRACFRERRSTSVDALGMRVRGRLSEPGDCRKRSLRNTFSCKTRLMPCSGGLAMSCLHRASSEGPAQNPQQYETPNSRHTGRWGGGFVACKDCGTPCGPGACHRCARLSESLNGRLRGSRQEIHYRAVSADSASEARRKSGRESCHGQQWHPSRRKGNLSRSTYCVRDVGNCLEGCTSCRLIVVRLRTTSGWVGLRRLGRDGREKEIQLEKVDEAEETFNTPQLYQVIADGYLLNVRQGLEIEGPVVRTLPPATQVEVFERRINKEGLMRLKLADGWISERRRGPIVPARTLPGNPAVRFATSLLGAGTLTSRASGVLSSGTDTGIRKCKITTSGGGCLFAKMMRHASHTLCVRAAPECSAPPEPVVTVSRRVCCCDYSENPSRFAGNCERHAGEAVCDCLPCRRCGGFPAPSSGCRGGTSQIGWGHCSRCYACGGRAPEQAISLSWEALTSVRLLTEIASALPHYPSHGHFLEEEQILLLDWQYQLGQRRMESGVPPCVQHGDATRSLTSPKRDVSHDGHQGNSGTNADEAGQGAMAGRGKCEWSRTTGANVGSSSCVVDACLASAGRHQAASMRPFARDGFGESTAENRPRRDGGLPRSLGSLATKLGVYKELLQPGDSHYDFCVVALLSSVASHRDPAWVPPNVGSAFSPSPTKSAPLTNATMPGPLPAYGAGSIQSSSLNMNKCGAFVFHPPPIIKIRQIERLHNPLLLQRYLHERESMLLLKGSRGCASVEDIIGNPILRVHPDHAGMACLNEFFLFHGCKADRAELIAVSGFDFRRGGENRGKLFGVGTYFSPLASKADLYTRPIREPSTTAPAGVRAGSVASSSTAVRAPSSNQVQSGAAKVDGSGSRGTFSNSKNNFTSVFKRGARTSTSHCSGRQTEAQPREERRGSKSRVRRLLAFASYGLWEGNNGGNGHNEVESPLSGTRAPLTSGDCGETRGECLACTRSFASVARIPRARSYCCRGLPGSSMINFPDEFQNGEDDNKLEEDDRDFREAQRQPSSENGISQRGEDTDGASANPKTAIRTLVLSRVCLGEVYKATRAMPEARMPPPMPGVSMDAFRGPCHPVVGSGNAGGGTSGTASSTSKGGIDALVCNPTFSEPQLIHYDSVMAENRTRGGVVDSIEFVVFERGQALPLYCITYTHDPSCCCASCYRYD